MVALGGEHHKAVRLQPSKGIAPRCALPGSRSELLLNLTLYTGYVRHVHCTGLH